MRKIVFGDQVTYYPDKNIDIYDGRDVRIKIEKPESYVIGDQCRLIYGFPSGVIGETILELYSPVVDINGTATVTFYLPIFHKFLSYTNLITGAKAEITFAVKDKGVTDYDFTNDLIVTSTFFCHFSGSRDGNQLPPIPVFFYSEHALGVFQQNILNKQLRSTDDGGFISFRRVQAGTVYWDNVVKTTKTVMLSAGQVLNTGIKNLKILASNNFTQAQKLDNPLECVQLLWSEYGYETVRAFWFKVKEIEYDAEKWGEIREKKDLLYSEDASLTDTAELVHDAYFRKKKLILTSGIWERRIIDMLMPIVASPVIYKYNPFPIYKTSVGDITWFHVFEKHDDDATLVRNKSGEYTFKKAIKSEDYILQRGQEYELRLALSTAIHQYITIRLLQGAGKHELINDRSFYDSSWRTRIFTFSLASDKDVSPVTLQIVPDIPVGECYIKTVRVRGNVGAYEVADIERKALRVIMHDSKMAEIELTLNDDIQKPDYVVF